ncbi:MAG TPA: TonB-dependent receptor, partial [Rhodocyclaceae bacterium]|nr:TonB-dependent receptor [Rhodocyclaceae bacterium]
ARKEKVEYDYAPTTGTGLQAKHDLSAFDIGANYRVNEQLSVFSNYNSAYQAPNIDQFFITDFGTGIKTFNQFISPAKARTINLGLNFDTARNKLRTSLFYSKLKNEIYYDLTSNTNIDKSHKYGLELQDRWQVRDNLNLSALYSYTRAKIDDEGSISGKELPGVPRHSATFGATYKPWETATFNFNHVWRSSAYAINDLSNNLKNRQSVFSSTNVAFRQRFGKVEGYVGVDNLFDRANGLWVSDTAVYPVDFRRTWKVGMKLDLL